MGKSAGSKAGGGGGGGGNGKSTGGGGSPSAPTVEVKSRDIWGGSSTANVPVNPVTQELSRGGQLQNTRLNIADNDGFKFGQEMTVKGFAVDRRGISNDTNRALRQESLKVKIYKDSGKNRIPFLDETGVQYYVEPV
jgi:hypothetical protein